MKFVSSILLIAVMIMVATATKCPESPFIDPAYPVTKTPKDLNATELYKHEMRMKVALDTIKAVPNGRFGAAIFDDWGNLMCTGVNMGKVNRIFHGEIVAIQNCSTLYTKNIFEGWSLYTTGEPCPMCAAALMWTKFKTVVFGSYVSNMYCERCLNQLPMSAAVINSLGYGIGFNYELIGGILEKETDKLFPGFCSNPKSDPSGIQPICNNGWTRKCSANNSMFGAFDGTVNTYHSDSEDESH